MVVTTRQISKQQRKVSSFAHVKKNLSHIFTLKLKLAEVEFVVSGMHSFAAAEDRVSERVSNFLTAHQHIIGYSVPTKVKWD